MSYNSKYTGAEVDAAIGKALTALQEHQDISGKQDVINDLATIRANAAKGATALQSVPSEYVTETELSNKGYATTSSMNTELAKKQDTVSDLATIRSGAALGATALQSYTETDPTVPSWAKAATKPSYTASEVGAVSKNGDTMTGNLTIEKPSYPNITTRNTSVDAQFALTEADDGTCIIQNESNLSGNINYATVYLKPAEQGIENMLSIGLSKDGKWIGATVLHTSNYTSHITPNSIGALSQSDAASTYATKTELSDKGTYTKPSTGIPKTDLASTVQTSLGKADTALQQHQDISGKINGNGTITKIVKVTSLPSSPDANTLYVIV